MSNWQPMETAPKDGTEILVHIGKYKCVYHVYWCDEKTHYGWRIASREDYPETLINTPTSWQPIDTKGAF